MSSDPQAARQAADELTPERRAQIESAFVSDPRTFDELLAWAEHWAYYDGAARKTAHLFEEWDAANDAVEALTRERDALRSALAGYMSQFGQALDAHGIPYGPSQQEADADARKALAPPDDGAPGGGRG
jgi:hypothetical protein